MPGPLAPVRPGNHLRGRRQRGPDLAAIQAFEKQHPEIKGIHVTVNRGQSAAMLAGLHTARNDVLVILDGDLQNDPADIPALVEALDGYDVVCGYRANRRDTFARRVASKIGNSVRNRATGDGIRDTGCSLKAFRRNA